MRKSILRYRNGCLDCAVVQPIHLKTKLRLNDFRGVGIEGVGTVGLFNGSWRRTTVGTPYLDAATIDHLFSWLQRQITSRDFVADTPGWGGQGYACIDVLRDAWEDLVVPSPERQSRDSTLATGRDLCVPI